MRSRTRIWKLGISGLLVVALGLAAACSSGVSKQDYDTVKQQLTSEQQKSAALQQQLSGKVQEAADAQQKLAAKEKEVADLQKSGAGAGVTLLLGAKAVPTPTPRPTPTPLPPGFTPPAPPVPPASYYQPLQLFIYADTVTAGPNESRYNYDATGIPNPSCVITSIFKRGMHLVWRWEIADSSTGKRLTDKEVDKAVVRLPSGDEIKGRFGRHGSTADAPWFWTAAWDIPMDYPLGTLDWTIDVVSKDSKTGTFKQMAVSIPALGVESRTQIIGD